MYAMESSKLTELQFTTLDGMADDYEDVEQLASGSHSAS
jgi:hypothetical protein